MRGLNMLFKMSRPISRPFRGRTISSVRTLCVAGARPNFMKVKPVLDALEARRIQTSLVHTGQHYDPAMSDVFFADLGIRQPDVHLGVGSGSHGVQMGAIMAAFQPVVERIDPDVVVVVGDVNSTAACALVAAKQGCLVAHVEAGLRSRDWSMPEEINRVVTDRVSDYLFAPSQDAVQNLRAEGYREDQISLVGNVMVDTLLSNLERARARPIASQLGLEADGYALVTLHRPTNVDDQTSLQAFVGAFGQISQTLPVVWPVHPRTSARLSDLVIPPGLAVIEPVGYLDFIALESAAKIVLTDSGGVQEETTVLGVPCLTLRDNTERPITVSEGTNRVAGRDPEQIVATTLEVLNDPPAAIRPDLWDGNAGARIAARIEAGGGPDGHLRPTD